MADLSNLKINESFQRVLQRDPTSGYLEDLLGNAPTDIIFNGTTLVYRDDNEADGYVLTSDADGSAKWAPAGGGGSTDVYWSASSVDGSFIVNSGMTNSKIGIGTLIPNHELSVSGTVSASSKLFVGDGGGTISGASIIAGDVLNSKGTLIVTGNTVLNGTLSATTSLKVGNGDGFISAATIDAPTLSGISTYGDTIYSGSTNLADILITLSAHSETPTYWSASSVDGSFIVNSGTSANGVNPNKLGVGTLTPNHELTVSGAVSASTALYGYNLYTNNITTTATSTDTLTMQSDIIQIKSHGGAVEYLQVSDDKFVFFFDGTEGISLEGPNDASPGYIFNVANQDIDFKIGGPAAYPTFNVYADTQRIRIRDHLAIGDNSSISHANSVLWGLAVTGSSLFFGSETGSTTHAIHASGVISGSSEVLVGDGDGFISAATIDGQTLSGVSTYGDTIYSGSTDLADILITLSAHSETPTYWSASSVDGTFIVNSGLTTSKIGIGTTIPNHELSVSGTVSASTKILVGDGKGFISAATIHAQTLSGGTDVYVGEDLYTDMIRRASSNSTTTKIKNNASNWEVYAGSSSLWSTKVSSQQLEVGQGGAGLISAATLDSLTQKVGNGTAFSPRPNLYWFANCDAATVSPASDGSFPSTNTTDVSWGETHNSDATVYSFSAEEVTIERTGIYQFTYNVTLETGADGSASNRTGGGVALLKDGAVVDGSESYLYCRMATPQTEKNTATISVMVEVTAGDVFKIVFIRTGASNAASKLGTIPAGTAWTIEAIS